MLLIRMSSSSCYCFCVKVSLTVPFIRKATVEVPSKPRLLKSRLAANSGFGLFEMSFVFLSLRLYIVCQRLSPPPSIRIRLFISIGIYGLAKCSLSLLEARPGPVYRFSKRMGVSSPGPAHEPDDNSPRLGDTMCCSIGIHFLCFTPPRDTDMARNQACPPAYRRYRQCNLWL